MPSIPDLSDNTRRGKRMKTYQHRVFGIIAAVLIVVCAVPLRVQADHNDRRFMRQIRILNARILELEAKLAHIELVEGAINGLNGPHVIFAGVNVHIQSGGGATDGPLNGLGNLIVGYNGVGEYRNREPA